MKNQNSNVLFLALIVFSTLAICSPAYAENTLEETLNNVTSTDIQIEPTLETSTTTEPTTSTEENQPTVHLDIRFENTLFFSDNITIPHSTTTIDSKGAQHPLGSNNVLKTLLTADTASDAFAVTDLQYYDLWGSFYLNCIGFASSTTSLCGNWNYVVDGIYPSVGMDTYTLNGGEHVYIYFNNPWNITASTSTFELGTTTTLHTWRYNYEDVESEWISDPDNIIDISIENPNTTGWWDAYTTVATTTSSELGETSYIFNTTGTYYAKITSSDYSKWSNPITIHVLDVAHTQQSQQQNPTQNSNSSEIPPLQKSTLKNTVDKAFTYLVSQQKDDGGFGSSLFTDWVAMAFGKNNSSISEFTQAKNKLKTNLNSTQIDFNSLTDYERHVLALKALDLNTNEFAQHIQDSFDGLQFGDEGLINDDIFAILSLCEVGQCSNNAVKNSAKQIKKDFDMNNFYGSDLTSAGVRALLKVYDKTDSSIVNAINYLKSNQNNDGSFGQSGLELDTTSWVLDAIGALGNTTFDGWTKSNETPFTYILNKQNEDGSFGNTNKVWSTSYTLIGLAYNWSENPGSENIKEPNSTLSDPIVEQTIATSTPTTTLYILEINTSTTSTPQIGEGYKIDSEETIEEITQIIPTENPVVYTTQTPTQISSNIIQVRGEKIVEEETMTEPKLDTIEENNQPPIAKQDEQNTPEEQKNDAQIPMVILLIAGGVFGAWRLIKFIV